MKKIRLFVFCWVSMLFYYQMVWAGIYLHEDLQQDSGAKILPLISPDTKIVYNWQLEEIWRLGGEDEDDVPLGFVKSVLYKNNKIYILDTKESKTYIIDINGKCLDVLDISGDAPGQCSNPNGLLPFSNNLFALIQGQPAKIVVTDFYKFYPYSRQFLISGAGPQSYVVVNGAYYNANKFLAYTETSILLDRDKMETVTIKALSTFSGDGKEISRYFSKEDKERYRQLPTEITTAHYAYREHYAIDVAGRVYVAPHRDKYLIYIFSPQASLESVIGRNFSLRKRTQEEMFLASFMGEYQGQKFEMSVEPEEAVILGFYILNSQLLVRHSYSEYKQATGVYSQLDLFVDNQLQGRVNLLAPGNARRDDLYFLTEDLLAVVKGNKDFEQQGIEKYLKDYEASPVQVILYRIHKND